MKFLFPILVLLLSFTSCEDIEQTRTDQLNIDLKLIDQYVSDQNLVMKKTDDPIYYLVEQPGTSEHPQLQHTVTVKYKGYFLDGTEFDSGNEVDIELYNTIEGWQIALPLIGIGGIMKVIIPSEFAYAGNEIEGRKNAVLAFDIELINFK